MTHTIDSLLTHIREQIVQFPSKLANLAEASGVHRNTLLKFSPGFGGPSGTRWEPSVDVIRRLERYFDGVARENMNSPKIDIHKSTQICAVVKTAHEKLRKGPKNIRTPRKSAVQVQNPQKEAQPCELSPTFTKAPAACQE